ncbi:hypothetical protein Ahy_B03g063209 [Arachis hypogaea]|uniref:MULE transposase domain-containing protein n=1 Tax=Arachis hypogaea TaxID=3818 RepID=A0A444ZX28_ARAHY|nr:hypothetical protein Ahy_B03g063209 [Arachis hypogaea]
MEVDIVEPLVCVTSGVSENLPYEQENLVGDVAGHGQQSNKVLQLSDISEVGSEEMEFGDESQFACFIWSAMLPDHGCLQKDEIPRVGMRFAQLEMANDFYVTYAKKIGFATKIRTTTYDKITKIPVNQAIQYGRIQFLLLGARQGYMSNMQDWVLFKVDLRHSHPCSARNAVHYHEYRKLSMHAKCMIENNDEAGIRPNKTFLTLANEAGGPSNLGFSEKDLRNYITARLRTSNMNADIREMMSYFMRMKEINPNFFYAVKASYEYYGDVVSVDSTYSTNRHGLPFVSFVGVNHHGRSTLLGCALLGNEEIASYEWVFSQWVKCVGTAPQRIITDQCKSICRAITHLNGAACGTNGVRCKQFPSLPQDDVPSEIFSTLPENLSREWARRLDCCSATRVLLRLGFVATAYDWMAASSDGGGCELDDASGLLATRRRCSLLRLRVCVRDEWMTCDSFERRWRASLMVDDALWLSGSLNLSFSQSWPYGGGRMEDGRESGCLCE